MADYYPLLARALDGLADPTPDAREAVYERARTALVGQLRSLNPPLSEPEIDRERTALDEAIGRIERGYAAPSRQAPPAADLRPPAPVREPEEGGIRTPPIKRGGRRKRTLVAGLALIAVIAPIGVAAWLWRDQLQPQPSPAPEPARPSAPVPAASDPKFSERVGGGAGRPASPAAPAEPPAAGTARPPVARAPDAPASAGVAGGAAQPDVAVAQGARLIEETADARQPKLTGGRVVWRLDAVNAGQGQPLETVVRANVDIPDAKMSLALLFRLNRDQALPASHTMELAFTTATSGEDARTVRDVNPPLMSAEENARGVPIAALAVPVRDNLFLIGLSSLKSDIDRNVELLTRRNWIEIQLRFASGSRANLVFEKGLTGERVMADAFRIWSQQQPPN